MRLSDDQIKQAILHPEEEIRLTALRYFTDAHSRDETVMPVVIEAVERHGREQAYRLLRDAERLTQTDATVEWMIAELDQEFDESDLMQDNYRFALGLALCSADPTLLACRHDVIHNAVSFPVELEEPLAEIIEMSSWDWRTAWQEFEQLGQKLSQETDWSVSDHRRLGIVVRSLARCADAQPGQVLDLLRRRYRGRNKALMQWLEPQIIELAGELRLGEAVPCLIERLGKDDDDACDASITALCQIGDEAVVQAIQREWPQSDEELHVSLAEVLEHVRHDLGVRLCEQWLEEEDDLNVALCLGHALLAQLATEGIEPVRALVQGDDEEPEAEVLELRHHLVEAATVMDVFFPEYEEWLQQARATNWGWGDYQPTRLSDTFRGKFDRGEELDEEEDAEEREFISHEELDADEPCPCGSGQLYGDCCWEKDFSWVRDEQGKIYRSLPAGDELRDMLEGLREAFVAEHGRNPEAGDPLFPGMPHPEHLEAMMAEMMKQAGMPPAIIYAFEQTGLLVTEENQNQIPDVDLARWEAAIEEYESRQATEPTDRGQAEFPLGTVACYGPNATVTTKIVAAVILHEGAEPILERWVGTGVKDNPKVRRQLAEFFQRHGVNSVAAADGNLGCPHEEGEDFPAGEDCPYCPYWKGKQGSGGQA